MCHFIFDYYGEVDYQVSYKGEKEVPFAWMYVDYNTLQKCGFFRWGLIVNCSKKANTLII
ncbi:hypothetical protein CCAN12_710074 [Capnocytophaga canimorsus]|uniref:Uncharacterized protein n=1 Tax=Capnocytophaga canimorsus TaxID=28188 RepID=A0A0B7HIZ2_9FLAO|nr:hypothetical protein CCAN12_710074 [Capnocytophaga canimorsus]